MFIVMKFGYSETCYSFQTDSYKPKRKRKKKNLQFHFLKCCQCIHYVKEKLFTVQRFTFHIVNQLSLYSEPFCEKMSFVSCKGVD